VEKDNLNALGATRRSLLVGSGAAITTLAGTHAMAAVSNTHPPVAEPVAGPYPVPPVGRTAGPILPNRGSSLEGKVAVVTGAARGIGRAIAVEFAANGADVVALDIAGPVSPTADAIPATEDELQETVAQIQHYGRRATAVKADIRDMATLRQIADQVEHAYGKIDIVVANAAIQGWKPVEQDACGQSYGRGGLGGTCADSAPSGWLASARRYLAGGGLPCFRRRRTRDRG
jgi:short chain dehydrogenase